MIRKEWQNSKDNLLDPITKQYGCRWMLRAGRFRFCFEEIYSECSFGKGLIYRSFLEMGRWKEALLRRQRFLAHLFIKGLYFWNVERDIAIQCPPYRIHQIAQWCQRKWIKHLRRRYLREYLPPPCQITRHLTYHIVECSLSKPTSFSKWNNFCSLLNALTDRSIKA